MQYLFKTSYKFSQFGHQFDINKNYYEVLKIKQTNSKSVIRDAYLKLAKKYHPDINPNGKQTFTLIQQAYQVLSDDKKKKQYDIFCSKTQSRTSTYSTNFQHNSTQETAYSYYKQYKQYQKKQGSTSNHKTNQSNQHYKNKNNNSNKSNNYYGQEEGYQTKKFEYSWQDIISKRKQWTKQFYEQTGRNEQQEREKERLRRQACKPKQKSKLDKQYEKVQYMFSFRNPFGSYNDASVNYNNYSNHHFKSGQNQDIKQKPYISKIWNNIKNRYGF